MVGAREARLRLAGRGVSQTVAGIAGAVVGGVIGFFAGNPVLGAQLGFALASTGYALLNPPKTQGPRLGDLQVQRAEYGGGITWGMGVFRTSGTVIWQTELEEHEHSSGGKGGGGESTSYTYSNSFAILICEGPIIGLRRIWKNKKVIWSGGEMLEGFRLYLGDATQDPDPTIESDPNIGAGNVPDYRGYAYIVGTDIDTSDSFNAMGNYEFEVEVSGGALITRVSTFNPTESGHQFTGQPGFAFDGAYMEGGQLVVCRYEEDSPESSYFEVRHNLYTGDIEDTSPATSVPNVAGSSLAAYLPATNSNIAFGVQRGAGTGPETARWYVAGVRLDDIVEGPTGTTGFNAVSMRPFVDGDYIYAAGGSTTVLGKWAFTNSEHTAISGESEAEYYDIEGEQTGDTSIVANTVSITVGDDGYLYIMYPTTHGASSRADLVQIDRDTMAQVKIWDLTQAELIEAATQSTYCTFTVYRGHIAVNEGGAALNLWAIPDDVSDPFVEVDSTAVDNVDVGSGVGPFLNLGGGYVLGYDGVFYIGALDTVGACVAAISGYGYDAMDASLYDVTDLTDKLRGFRIGAPMTKGNAIEPLRNGYFFGYAEVDGVALFRHTFHEADFTIPEEDVAAYQDGSEPPAPIKWVDTPEDEIPWRVIVKFIDADGDYQPGTAIATRTTGTSRVETTLDLPIVLTYAEAKAIAETHIARAELERLRGTFTTSRKWLKTAPLDVVTIGDQTVRITDTAWALGEVVQFSCTPTQAAMYSGVASVGSSGTGSSPGGTGGGGGTTVKKPLAPTESVLMDIPNVTGTGAPFGFSWAAGPRNSNRWPGAVLYKSYDEGTNYVEVARKTTPDIIGAATDALGAPSADPDITNVVTVRLTRAAAELVTVTDDALAGGANRWALGVDGAWEILQSRDADLVSPQVYDLSYHLRGRFDTDANTGGHVAGDQGVVLPVTIVAAPESDLDQTIWYQAVTIGGSISPTGWVEFINTGLGMNIIEEISGHITPSVIAAGGMVPTYIGPTETFTVPANRQALFATTIDNEGILDLEGVLIGVD
jgi:hypothetical protein